MARVVSGAGRSVMTFTGYTYRHLLNARRADYDALLEWTDLLAAGPFLQDRVDHTRPWVGSSNQELRLLSNRFPGLLGGLPQTPDRLEVRVDAAGLVRVNGWADAEALDLLLAGLAPAEGEPGQAVQA